MSLELRQSGRVLIASLLTVAFLLPTQVIAQTHLVNPTDLQKEMVNASQSREHNLATVRQFLSTPTAEKAMKSARIDAQRVNNAVSTLNDDELAQLSSRASQAQQDFAAGKLSDRDLILIILAIAALVLIIVAVR